MAAALPLLQLPSMASSSSSSSSLTENTLHVSFHRHRSLNTSTFKPHSLIPLCLHLHLPGRRRTRTRRRGFVFSVGKEDTELRVVSATDDDDDEVKQQQQEIFNPEEQDLEDIRQIQRVLKLLKKNRDMLFNEVKLTITIEDPREIERKRLLGIEDPNTPTREDLADALDDVNEGRIPENRAALRMLAEEMVNWPNLEVESTKKKPSKSLYAKATDTGVDPKVAAKRLKVDWDSAAEIEDNDENEDVDVPSVVGFGALYLVSAFPIIIGVSVVLILFYNSLQ